MQIRTTALLDDRPEFPLNSSTPRYFTELCPPSPTTSVSLARCCPILQEAKKLGDASFYSFQRFLRPLPSTTGRNYKLQLHFTNAMAQQSGSWCSSAQGNGRSSSGHDSFPEAACDSLPDNYGSRPVEQSSSFEVSGSDSAGSCCSSPAASLSCDATSPSNVDHCPSQEKLFALPSPPGTCTAVEYIQGLHVALEHCLMRRLSLEQAVDCLGEVGWHPQLCRRVWGELVAQNRSFFSQYESDSFLKW